MMHRSLHTPAIAALVILSLAAAPGAQQARGPRAAPQPAVGAIETGGSASRGAASAKVVIVEFSDYQCPFCGRYSRQTLPRLLSEYVDSGQVRYIFRNFPLDSIHPNAFAAALAAECAGDQGKFWQMHDRLFGFQKDLGAATLREHARAIGMDVSRFQQCLGSPQTIGRVRRDQVDAKRAGARSTPAFFIGVPMRGRAEMRPMRMIVGAKPYQTFKDAIDGILALVR